jgi:hypothetical protein
MCLVAGKACRGCWVIWLWPVELLDRLSLAEHMSVRGDTILCVELQNYYNI